MLAQAVKVVPVGVAYAMWSGLGTAAIVTIGAVFLGEPLRMSAIVGIALIIGGVVLVNLSSVLAPCQYPISAVGIGVLISVRLIRRLSIDLCRRAGMTCRL